ncbi:MAG: branched-chain amino acid ABC transporter permease [Chloroflexi bacterium]|nr:branched-chain amino acid ABC transporter permease [Chloroflexota bacterium]
MSDTLGFYGIQFLNGMAYSLLLFLLAMGLSLIFGMMDVMNLAHGSLYMIGAYVGLFFLGWTGQFWIAVVLVPIAVGIIGIIMEASLLRPLYRRGHLDQVLLTFGLSFVFMDMVKWIWGADIRSLPAPPGLAKSAIIFGRSFPEYRLFVIVIGLILALALWAFLERTRLGAVIRAGVADKEMVSGLGINITLVFTLVFGLGAALAGLSGIIAGPVLGLYPGMDFETLIITLIVVVVGGLGTLKGSFWGAILIGQAQTFGKVLVPDFALLIVFVIMAIVLLARPSGLFGKEAA